MSYRYSTKGRETKRISHQYYFVRGYRSILISLKQNPVCGYYRRSVLPVNQRVHLFPRNCWYSASAKSITESAVLQ